MHISYYIHIDYGECEMTVAELIEKLEQCDQDAMVKKYCYTGEWNNPRVDVDNVEGEYDKDDDAIVVLF